MHDGDNAVQPHAGIYMCGRQRIELSQTHPIILDEHQIPDFKITLAVAVYAAHMAWHTVLVTGCWSPIHVNFTARSAWTGFSHFPKIILASKFQHMAGIHAWLFFPEIGCIIICGQIAFIVFKYRSIKKLGVNSPFLG